MKVSRFPSIEVFRHVPIFRNNLLRMRLDPSQGPCQGCHHADAYWFSSTGYAHTVGRNNFGRGGVASRHGRSSARDTAGNGRGSSGYSLRQHEVRGRAPCGTAVWQVQSALPRERPWCESMYGGTSRRRGDWARTRYWEHLGDDEVLTNPEPEFLNLTRIPRRLFDEILYKTAQSGRFPVSRFEPVAKHVAGRRADNLVPTCCENHGKSSSHGNGEAFPVCRHVLPRESFDHCCLFPHFHCVVYRDILQGIGSRRKWGGVRHAYTLPKVPPYIPATSIATVSLMLRPYCVQLTSTWN